MKIALVCHPYHRGGVTTWMVDFFKEGKRRKVDIDFVTLSPKKPFISAPNRPTMLALLGESKDVFFKDVDFYFELGTFSYRINVYIEMIKNNIPKGSVLIPSDDEAIWAACASLAGEYIFLGVLHSDDEKYYELARSYGNYISAFIIVSHRIKNKLDSDKPVEVIPCGIPLQKFDFTQKKKNTVVWIGRLEEHQKRVSDIIPFAKKMAEAYPDWKLYVVGEGDQSDWLKEQLILNDLQNHLHLKGWGDAEYIRSILSECAVFLQTSNFEGMSVAVMEALASGCKILSSRVSGIEDQEDLEESAGIVAVYPIGAIENAFEQFKMLIQNQSPDMGEKAYQLAKKNYSIQTCFSKYEMVAKDLLPTQNMVFSNKYLLPVSHLVAVLRKLKLNLST